MNVHGIHDRQPTSAQNFRRNPRSNNQYPDINRNQRQENDSGGFFGDNGSNWTFTVEQLRAVEEHKVLFISGNTRIKNPRDENYWDMLKITCCPVIKFFSITLLILITQLIMYVIQCIKGINKKGDLLQIKAQVLFDLGANHSPSVEDGEVWRLVAAQFLHVTFIHFVGNFLTTLIFVSRVEYTFGWWKTLIIYLVSGIGGNIFSDLTDAKDNTVKAGASTSLYGIIGAILGYIILNWRGLSVIGPLLKCQLVFIAIIIVLFIFILTPYGENIDYMGHLGGFLIGITICAIHQTIRKDKQQKILRVCFLTMCAVMLILWFLLFYLT